MAFRVFLSYSLDPGDQALAWRLQTLAAAHRIEVYVPPRLDGVTPRRTAPPAQVISAIDRADCVLAIINARADADAQQELRYALAKQKLVIPIVRSDFANHPLLAQFHPVFAFSPWDNPGKVEGDVLKFLKDHDLSKQNRRAVGGLVALGLALLLLSSSAKA